MTPRAAGAALSAPFRDCSQLLSGLMFWLPAALGVALYQGSRDGFRLLYAGGLALALAIALPGLIAYLLQIVESRALRRRLPVPGVEYLLPFSGERRLFPLLPLAALVALSLGLEERSPQLALWLPTALAALLLPLHVMVLAITGSPLASILPSSLWRLARRLWPGWLWLPAAAGGASAALHVASRADLPGWLLLALAMLWLLALANLCGALLATLDIAAETTLAAPTLPAVGARAAATERQRRQVLDHAYGLVSRGNRAGGFAHIEQYAAAETDPLAAELWYFDALWRWDLGEVPLFYAQSLLTKLLDSGADVAAMKVTLRCLRANPRFRPQPRDLPRLRAVAAALGNDEVAAALGADGP